MSAVKQGPLIGNKIEVNAEKMYRELISTPDQALVHLAFHCSLKDGEIKKEELDFLATTFVAKGLNKSLDLKKEMSHYKKYYRNVKDEITYLTFLLELIHPYNKLALFAFCAEIIIRDGNISISEEVLLGKIAGLLYIKDTENLVVQQLITELYDVEKKNAF